MKKTIQWLVDNPKKIIGVYFIVILVSGILSFAVGTNYNMVEYLPKDMGSSQAIDVMREEYGLHGTANILIEVSDIQRVLEIKSEIQAVENVDKVIWLDDVVDIVQPIEFIDESLVSQFYKDGYAYMQVLFEEDDYSITTTNALTDIRVIIDGLGSIIGPAVNSSDMATGLDKDMFRIVLLLVPILLFILIISTTSYLEVILFIITVLVSIIINKGTNIIFGEISFISASSSSLLQLAIAMDYSIFLLHRFGEEHKAGIGAKLAMTRSVHISLPVITSSALTTIVGFLSLTLMSFTIGKDMGFVLAKGILVSMICVTTLLPAMTVLMDPWIQKTKHRDFLPSFRKMAVLFEKGRFVIIGVLILVSIPAYLARGEIPLEYGNESSQTNPVVLEAEEKIKELFGGKNSIVLLVSNTYPVEEYTMANKLEDIDNINQVQGLYSFIDPTIPEMLVPYEVRDNFISEHYSRYIIDLDTDIESESAFNALEDIKLVAGTYYKTYYILGETAFTADTKEVSKKDIFIITTVSIIAVGLVLIVTFRAIIVPLLMVLTIQIAIWINMSVPYFAGTKLNYIGFLIVSALQLGATIDYAILLSNRYIENRSIMNKEEASIESVTKAGHSIFTSSTILGAAGLSMYFFFDDITLRSMGLLIGRGALLSGFIVIIVLPQVLLLWDHIIMRKKITYESNKGRE